MAAAFPAGLRSGVADNNRQYSLAFGGESYTAHLSFRSVKNLIQWSEDEKFLIPVGYLMCTGRLKSKYGIINSAKLDELAIYELLTPDTDDPATVFNYVTQGNLAEVVKYSFEHFVTISSLINMLRLTDVEWQAAIGANGPLDGIVVPSPWAGVWTTDQAAAVTTQADHLRLFKYFGEYMSPAHSNLRARLIMTYILAICKRGSLTMQCARKIQTDLTTELQIDLDFSDSREMLPGLWSNIEKVLNDTHMDSLTI